MKRVWRLATLSFVAAVGFSSLVGCCKQSWDMKARWASFSHDMCDLNKSIDRHFFNYDWDDPYLP